ncbi:hypothetical protein MJH12_18250 [bacterium]|nr:hypothetical protein [bacterium]
MNEISIILLGYGNIGQAFHQRVLKQLETIQTKYQVLIHMDLILRSSSHFCDGEWFENSKPLLVFEEYLKKFPQKKYLIVDCTASDQMIDLYLKMNGVTASVIAANKIPLSVGSVDYHKLMKHFQDQKISYFYEATVGAGLPVVQSLRNLIDAGDQIESIQGVFSGTLSYLFSKTELSFSQRIQEAYDLKYTEPDPRIDLSGLDVARKCLVLARVMGLDFSLDDIRTENLVTEDLREIGLKEFFGRCHELDEKISNKEKIAHNKNRNLTYMGKISHEGIFVGLFEVGSSDPFYGLEGTSNLIQIQSKMYPDAYSIQGPGAGIDVTVCGLFSDLLQAIIELKS